jgi:hypothetical protein
VLHLLSGPEIVSTRCLLRFDPDARLSTESGERRVWDGQVVPRPEFLVHPHEVAPAGEVKGTDPLGIRAELVRAFGLRHLRVALGEHSLHGLARHTDRSGDEARAVAFPRQA